MLKKLCIDNWHNLFFKILKITFAQQILVIFDILAIRKYIF